MRRENGFESEVPDAPMDMAERAVESERKVGHEVSSEEMCESDIETGRKNGGGVSDSGPEGEKHHADTLLRLMDITRYHRNNMKVRTGMTNRIKGAAKGVALARMKQAGETLPKGKWPAAKSEDEAVVRKHYPIWFVFVADLTKVINQQEKEIEKIVKGLTIADWIGSIKGLGPKSVGYLLGITGDLRNYPHPRMVVKRLGIAPRDAYFDPKYGKNLLPKQRRAITLYWCVDSLLRQDNKYRVIYLNEKRRQVKLNPEFASATYDPETARGAKIGAELKARIRAATVLVYDLWAEWNGDGERGSERSSAFVPPKFLTGDLVSESDLEDAR